MGVLVVGYKLQNVRKIDQIWCFPFIEDKEEEFSLNKVQTNKKAWQLCYEQRAEHAQSLFIANIVKVESLDQDFCEAGINQMLCIPEPDALGLALGLQLPL